MGIDYETLPAETVEILEEIKQLMDKPWEEYAREMARVIWELSTDEDFNHDMYFNHPEIAFHRKWYHACTKRRKFRWMLCRKQLTKLGEPMNTTQEIATELGSVRTVLL